MEVLNKVVYTQPTPPPARKSTDDDLRAKFKEHAIIAEQATQRVRSEFMHQIDEYRSIITELQNRLDEQTKKIINLQNSNDKLQQTVTLYKHKNNTLDRNIIKLLQGALSEDEKASSETQDITAQINDSRERIHQLKKKLKTSSKSKLSKWKRMSQGKSSRVNNA